MEHYLVFAWVMLISVNLNKLKAFVTLKIGNQLLILIGFKSPNVFSSKGMWLYCDNGYANEVQNDHVA